MWQVFLVHGRLNCRSGSVRAPRRRPQDPDTIPGNGRGAFDDLVTEVIEKALHDAVRHDCERPAMALAHEILIPLAEEPPARSSMLPWSIM